MLTVVEVPDLIENASDGFYPELKPDQATGNEANPIATGPIHIDQVKLPVFSNPQSTP